MFPLSLLTRKGRARYRASKLIRGKKEVPVTVDSVLTCINGLKAVYLNSDLVDIASEVRIGFYYEPDKLKSEFCRAIDLILDEEQPERRRYGPAMERLTLERWLWSSDGKPLGWKSYMEELLPIVESFLRLLRDQYEIEGKAVAGYRLEQMYYPLCDIISLTEAFYAE